MKSRYIFLKLSLFFLVVNICIQPATSQVVKLKYDATLILGTWLANDGENSYELTFDTDIVYEQTMKEHQESLFGALVYKKGGEVIRKTELLQFHSIISGTLLSPHLARLSFTDKQRKIAGRLAFEIDPDNPDKAVWRLYKSGNWLFEGWGKVDFDIPTELEWTKVE